MYDIVFYHDKNDYSELENELKILSLKGETNKDARIQFDKIAYYIKLLKQSGSFLSTNISKHIVGELWELRPGNNRVLYFFFENKGTKRHKSQAPTKDKKKDKRENENE